MRRSLAAMFLTAIALTSLAACGDDGKAEPEKAENTAGMKIDENVATATQYFAAVASNDPAQVAAAYELAAPDSPALSFLKLVHDGLTQVGTAEVVTVDNGRYRLCKADAPTSCHTYSQVTLADGKINDFTVDGEKIRIR